MRSLIAQIKKTYRMAEPDERDTVLHNFAFLSVLQALTYLLPLIVLPYLFRVIGPDKFGLLAFAQAFIQYFVLITDYGFNLAATKEISLRHNEPEGVNRIYSAVISLKLSFMLVSLAILATLVFSIPRFRHDWPVYILSFGTVAGTALFPVWLFQGMEKMRYIAKLNIFGEILRATLIFTFIRAPQDYIFVPLIHSLVLASIGLWGQSIAFTKLHIRFRAPGWACIREQLHAGWNVFISLLAINVYTTTRIFAVGLFTNNITTGLYSVAEQVAGFCQTFPLSSFSQAVFPRLSKIFHRDKYRAFQFMEQIQKITVNISLICLPLIFVFAPVIMKVIFGGNLPETVLALRLLLIAVLFVSSNAFRVQFLLVCGRPHLYSRIHVVMAALGLPLILTLIYFLSYVGAALATIAIEAGIFAATFYTIGKLSFEEPGPPQ